MTLTEAAFWTKRFGIITLIVGFLFVVVLFFLFSTSTASLPPEYLTANFGCTEKKEEFLPHKLEIPSLDINPDSEMLFELQTDTGKVDTLPSIVNVYRYTNLGQIINSQAEAKILAKKMGFDPEKVIRQDTTGYIWRNNDTKKTLNVRARDLNFTMKTDVERIREIRRELDLPTEREAPSLATNTLRSLGVLEQVYTDVQPTVHLIDINPDGSYSQAESLVTAELIRVDFLRKVPMISIATNIENAQQMVDSLTKKELTYEIGEQIVNDERVDVYNFSTLLTYQYPVKTNISVYVGPKDDDNKIFPNIYQIEYSTWSVENQACGTYELISPSLALQRIQEGEGSLVYLNSSGDEVVGYTPQSVNKFRVDNIYITYYEGLLEQQYLQPVYMVEGQAELKGGERADFFIYYPAINYDIVQDRIDLPPATIKEEGILSF
ncbi:MAG: hypothetical protein RBT33_01120 [Candidatus Dojkabacteria bacterium]|jgi:hypothetical protein|nr:hypothetical protein [Candidatus Dojkabacteria bacterium]